MNIDDSSDGSRTTTGTDPEGNDTEMEYVNVHKGYKTRRYSEGCVTVDPDDWVIFSSHFDWSKGGGNKGNSTGNIKIYRGNRANSLKKLNDVTKKVNQQNKKVKQILEKSGY